ncbi:MAG: hypothetical protein AAF318_04170 [Pseudomonadota bacterium]
MIRLATAAAVIAATLVHAPVAHANAACLTARTAEHVIDRNAKGFMRAYPMSSLCAILGAGGALAAFNSEAEQLERQLGAAAAVGCAFYCAFSSDAACGHAAKRLVGYVTQSKGAEAARKRICRT